MNATGTVSMVVTPVIGARVASRHPAAIARKPPTAFGAIIRPYRKRLALTALLGVVVAALDLAAPWPLKVIVDNAIGHRPLPSPLGALNGLSTAALTTVAAAAGVALVLLSAVTGYAATVVAVAASERAGNDLRVATFDRLQRLPLRFHDANRTGDLVSRLTVDVGQAQDAMVAWFDTALPEAVTIVGILGLMVAIDGALALTALVVIPALVAFVWFSRPRLTAAQRESRDRWGQLASHSTEVLRHVRAVRAFNRQDAVGRRFSGVSHGAANAQIATARVGARFSPVADLVLALGTAVVLIEGVAAVTSGRISLGLLFVLLAYLSSLYGPIRSLTGLSAMLARGAASRQRLAEILPSPDSADAEADDSGARTVSCGPLPLSVRDVRFEYEPGATVLDGLSLDVRPGEHVCIVGQTGAGKSTLLSLLLRLYEVDGGTIRVGGTDVRDVRLASLRERIALVPQDPWILDGTIAENIAFGRAGATAEQVREAAAVAMVDEFAERMPNGFDTVVGEGGALLSGGQRRRIALARALLRDASVLLLDEPTSGLDAASEATVLRALARAARGRTVVMVSHRLALAEAADRVAVLELGRIVEEGPALMLRASGGHYARLCDAQTRSPDLDLVEAG